jgi:polar amino acid transport system substrate-binding protein
MKMKKLNNSLVLLLAAILMLGLFAGCGTPAPAPSATGPDESAAPAPSDEGSEGDAAYILDKGEMIIGITLYEPMNYKDESGELTGFDTEFAKLVCERLDISPEFMVINWDTKEIELEARTIDCIWNGMTITPDRSANMSISLPYVKNAQVIVVKADSGIATTADLVGKAVVAEIGSAGEAQIKGEEADENLTQAEYIGMSKQTDCLMEVKAGTADAAVLDWTLAKTMVGEGTDYADLVMIEDLELATEEYGIAFRKGSDLTEKVNGIILELVKDGSLQALADKYGLNLAPELVK